IHARNWRRKNPICCSTTSPIQARSWTCWFDKNLPTLRDERFDMNFVLITTLTACNVLMLWPASWAVDDAKPTKEAAIKVLTAFASALEANDVEKAWKYLYISGKIKEQEKKIKEAFKKRLSKILQSDISTKGVAILAKKGKWGKLAEVVGAKEAKGLTEMV